MPPEIRTKNAPDLPKDEMVLSLYLNTDASPGPWSERAGHLRSVLDTCVGPELDKRDRALFDQARRWVEEYATEHHAHGKSMALFYAPKTGQSWATHFQEPASNLARFGKGAYMEPLVALMSTHPRYAIVLVDNTHGRVVVTQMSEIVSSQDTRDYVGKRHRQTEHNSHIEQHHAVLVQRHMRHVVQMLEEMKQAKAFDYLVIGGASEAFPKFLRELPQDLAKLVKGQFTSPMYATDNELLKSTHEIIERATQGEHTWP